MRKECLIKILSCFTLAPRLLTMVLILAAATSFNIFSANLSLSQPPDSSGMKRASRPVPITPIVSDSVPAVNPDSVPKAFPDSIYLSVPRHERVLVEGDSIDFTGDSLEVTPVGAIPVDSLASIDPSTGKLIDPDYRVREFNPDPTRALWMSALCPGLGQLYNRRYWKLPIVVGAYVGLGYATNWNNRMLRDYTQAYRDITDNDPSTKSYMDFYPPNTDESALNKSWLEKVLKNKKDKFRRQRDLCIISMIGVYLVAMVDAYVDASLAHFDISDNLSMDMHPAVIQSPSSSTPGIGMQWAFNF